MGLGQGIRNLRDVQAFGLGVLARHRGRFAADKTSRVTLRGIGRVALRHANSDLECFRQVWQYREYSFAHLPKVEARIQRRYDDLVAAGRTPVIVDGGANVGAASLWFARQFPAATIVSVEPDAANFAVLAENVRDVGNIMPVHAALGAEPGFVAMTAPASGWAVQTSRASEGLPVITVDQTVATAGPGELLLAKIDIEGFEKDLFASNTAWTTQAYAIVIEPHDWMLPGEFSSAPFLKALGTGDFEIFICGENLAFVRADATTVV